MSTTSAAVINLEIVERLLFLKKQNRLAHAYLFIGPAFVGKSETALVLSKIINNELTLNQVKDGVDDEVINKIKAGHPDIHYLGCEYGESIKIDDVRKILDQVRLRPFQAEVKVFVIRNIESLTLEAANALLKTLEEPTSTSLLLLTTSVLENVLPTIRSRCQPVFFLTSSYDQIAADLAKNYKSHQHESQYLAFASDGCWGKAKKLKEENYFIQKNDYINQFIFSSSIELFVKNSLTDKTKIKDLLDVLLAWVRDCVVVKSGLPKEQCAHQDRYNDLVKFAKKFDMVSLITIYQQIVQASKMLNENLNVKMSLFIIKELING